MNIIKVFTKEKKQLSQFSIRIPKELLEEFDKLAKITGNNRNELANKMIYKFIKDAELEKEFDEDLLKNNWKQLFEQLEALLLEYKDQKIRIALREEEVGRESQSFTLVDFLVLTDVLKVVLLLEDANGKQFHKEFLEIYDISFSERDHETKVWLEMPEKNWRFYLSKK